MKQNEEGGDTMSFHEGTKIEDRAGQETTC